MRNFSYEYRKKARPGRHREVVRGPVQFLAALPAPTSPGSPHQEDPALMILVKVDLF